MKDKGLFITGTDTGVGKTYVAVGLVRAFVQDGMNVGVMKPAETGCAMRRGLLVPQDANALSQAAGGTDPIDLINPYRFREPLAPLVAAQRNGRRIDSRKILTAFLKLAGYHEIMIVEGAGGIMVPLSKDFLYLDLAEMLGLPVLIVARASLGTINHTLLTIEALRSRHIPLAGIVINQGLCKRPGLAERTSPAVIQNISGVPVIGVIRHGQADLKATARHLVHATLMK